MTQDLARGLWSTSPMMRGDDVLTVQSRLRAAGIAVDTDGLFGGGTRLAVSQFQQREGLTADGIVGPATWARLFPSAGAIVVPQLGVDAVLTPDALSALRQPHGRYTGGCAWHLASDGLQVEGGGYQPDGAEGHLAASVLARFAQPLATVLAHEGCRVPIELVVACICAESSGDAQALRREPGCDLADPSRTPSRVSLGLMQTLLSTARVAMGSPGLPLASLGVPQTSIEAGARYIFLQGRQTRFDPPLVAAAYNAGGLYFEGSAANRWRLRQYPIGTPNHVNRFVRYFNGALAALDVAALPGAVPSFKRLLASAA